MIISLVCAGGKHLEARAHSGNSLTCCLHHARRLSEVFLKT